MKIPEGCHSVTPQLTVDSAERAIEFYKRAFGAEELMRMPGPDGKRIMHAELRIGDSVFFVVDEFPHNDTRAPGTLGGTTCTMQVYVENVDAAFARAVAAGAKIKLPVEDMFWGDRYGMLSDPFGHNWGLATREEDLRPDEIRRRAQRYFARSAAASK